MSLLLLHHVKACGLLGKGYFEVCEELGTGIGYVWLERVGRGPECSIVQSPIWNFQTSPYRVTGGEFGCEDILC